MLKFNSPSPSSSPHTTNNPLATVCERLETSVKSFVTAAVQWDAYGRSQYGWNREAFNPDGEIQSVLLHIRTVQENSLWMNYPRRLQTDVIVSFRGCIDSVDQQTAYILGLRQLSITQERAAEVVQQLTKTLQDLKRDAKHNYEILSGAEEIQEEFHYQEQGHSSVLNVSPQGQAAYSTRRVSDILWELVDEIKALKAEVEDLRATPPGRRPVGNPSPRIRLEQFLHAPAAFLNSLANSPFSTARQQDLRPTTAGASLLSGGSSGIVAPPYELSESGRRQYGEWLPDGQRAYHHGRDGRMPMEQGERSTGSSEGSLGALTPRSAFSIPLRLGEYGSPHVSDGGRSTPSN